jgi:hypothetical protein
MRALRFTGMMIFLLIKKIKRLLNLRSQSLKFKTCQPELVEGGAINKRGPVLELTRLRQAQADTVIIRRFKIIL